MDGLTPGMPTVGDQFVIDQGDGDQEYFSAMIDVVLVDLDWSHARTRPHGEAILFEVISGTHKGEFIAATTGNSFERAFKSGGYSTAVVWRVVAPFSETPQVSNIGKTVIWRVGLR